MDLAQVVTFFVNRAPWTHYHTLIAQKISNVKIFIEVPTRHRRIVMAIRILMKVGRGRRCDLLIKLSEVQIIVRCVGRVLGDNLLVKNIEPVSLNKTYLPQLRLVVCLF